MNYNYNTLSDRELFAIREKQDVLRYEAQVELLETLTARGIKSPDLKANVLKKNEIVASLGYLKEMGYTLTTDAAGIKITRNLKSQLIDFFGSILGVVFIFIGAKGVVELWMHFNSEDPLSLSLLFNNGIVTILGYFGVRMLTGFSRFLDYLGMEFLVQKSSIVLKKRINFSVEKFEGSLEDVAIDETADTLKFLFKDIPVIIGNPNSKVQRLTMTALKTQVETILK